MKTIKSEIRETKEAMESGAVARGVILALKLAKKELKPQVG